MQALIAEANKLERIKFNRTLKRLGFEVEEVADELGAISLIYQPAPPELVILALDTVLVDFETICSSMRASNPDIHIVALVPADQKHRLVPIVQAGVNDFIVKPSTTQEIEARLRVLLHLTEKQAEHAMQASDDPEEAELLPALEALLEQATLETVSHRPTGTTESRGQEDSDREPPTRREPDEVLLPLFDYLDMPQAVHAAVRHLGWTPVEEVHPLEAVGAAFLTGWASFVLDAPAGGHWMDLRVDVSREHVARMAQAGKVAPSLAQMRAYVQEVVASIQEAVERQIKRLPQLRVYQPFDPFTIASDRIPNDLYTMRASRRQEGFVLNKQYGLRLMVVVDVARKQTRHISEMRQMDVLGGPIQVANGDMILLQAGVMLDRSYIAKLQTLSLTFKLAPHVPVFRPPSGVAVFLDSGGLVGAS